MSKLILTFFIFSSIFCCSSKESNQFSNDDKAIISVEQTSPVIAGQIAYIKQYRELAVSEMLKSGIPASVKLAQGMLETTHGNSILATQGNNHFGIKCKVDWTGMTMYADDDAKGECFRKYHYVEDSYRDHSNFLKYHRLKFYDKLFKIHIDNYKDWCFGLQECGYATAVTYARSLVRIIERYRLYELDAYHLDSKRAVTHYKEVDIFGDTIIVEAIKKNKIACVHVVKKGDTLKSIAKLYDMTIPQILYFNNFTEKDILKIGQAINLN